MPALVVPWGEIPPDPPFNPPAKENTPTRHPQKGKEKKEKEKKRKKALTPAFVNRIRH